MTFGENGPVYYGSLDKVEIYTHDQKAFDRFRKINQNRNGVIIRRIDNPSESEIRKAIKYDTKIKEKLNPKKKCACDG